MSSFEKRVVWTEGMMLMPQHFQQQSRYFESQIRGQVAFTREHHWGFYDLVIDKSLLKTGKFRVSSASGILPDGSYFSLPETDCAPAAIDIDESLLGKKIYLAVALTSSSQIEVARSGMQERVVRFMLEEIEVHDATDSSSLKTPLEVAGLKFYLLSDNDSLGAFACLPIAVIQDITRNKEVVVDEEFVPPTINVLCSSFVRGFLSELNHLITNRVQALASRVSVAGKASTFEVQDFLMLQSLNRCLPQVRHISAAGVLQPEPLYVFLTSLIGEMSVFTNASKLYAEQPAYEHNNLTVVFRILFEQLRQVFSTVLEQNAIQVPLIEKKYGVRVGVVSDKTMFGTCGFVLAVNADLPPDEIRQYLPPQLKIGSVEQIKELVNLQLPGISINTLAVAPREIPYKRNCVYFELIPKGSYWQSLSQSGGIALHIGANIPGLVVELWAIRNGEK